MKNKTNIIIQILIAIWLLAIIFIYFFTVKHISTCYFKLSCWQFSISDAHLYYLKAFKLMIVQNLQKSYVPNPLIYIVTGLIILYLANYIYERFVEKKKQLVLKLSPFFLFLFFTFVFAFVYERWLSFYNLETPIKFQGIFLRYPILILQVFSVSLVSLACGKVILDRLFKQYLFFKDKLAEFLFSFGFGIIIIIFVLFFLALFKLLIFKVVLAALIILFVLSIKNIFYWLKSFFSRNIIIETNYFNPYIFLYILIFIFLAHNFLELLRPIPLGFDDLTEYQNTPKLMAEEGKLLSGVLSYYWELFISLGFVLFKSATVSFLLSFLGSILFLIAFYFVSKTYFVYRNFDDIKARNLAMLSTAIFYTLPMTVFQSSKDMKVDLISIFFTLLSLFCFWQWKESFLKNKINNYSLLILAFFLVGFSMAIKYTNFFFLSILIIWAIYIIFLRYRFKLSKYFLILVFVIIALLPILPIAIRNIYQTKSLSLSNIRLGKPINDSIVINPPFNETPGIETDYQKYMKKKNSGVREELGRYTGYESWYKKYLLLPIRITSNTMIAGSYVDIGFLFLGLIPLSYLLLLKRRKKEKNRWLTEIAAFTLIFYLFWLFFASGVIWYGLGGFIFLCILLVEALISIKQNYSRYLYYFTLGYLIIWLVCVTVLRTTILSDYGLMIDPIGLKYARGEIDEKLYLEDKFQPYKSFIDIINQDIQQNPDNPPKVYRIGTYYKYMIIHNDKTVLDDQMIDKFAFAYQDKDDQKMIERFKNTGIKYLLIDRNLMKLDSTPEKSLLAKGDNFLKFLKDNSNNLELMTDQNDDRLMIFKIL